MRNTRKLDLGLRILLVTAGVAIAAWTGAEFVRAELDYRAWLETNHQELGRQQRRLKRFERRMDSRIYSELPEGTYAKDLLAAELAEPIVESLENERQQLYAARQGTLRRFQYGLGCLVVLLVIVRLLTPASRVG